MHLDDVTPMIITYNEEPNIGRVLERLGWAKDIVVVDSFSSDRTLEIVRAFRNTRIVQRVFDDFATQCNFGLGESAIRSEWVLALDADYLVSDALRREIEALAPAPEVAGYEAEFRFCIHGHPLRRSLYPARAVLFRRQRGTYLQDGHAHKLKLDGTVLALRERVDLDDRKPLSRWVANQDRYARDERDKLARAADGPLNLADRIRRWRFLAPVIVLFYCLFAKRMIFEGLPGWYYTYQRVTAEILLSLYLIEERLDALDATETRPAATGDGR